MPTFITQEIRDREGQFIKATDRAMTNLGIERMGICEACGHDIDNHFGVRYPDAERYMWVGSVCFRTLTRGTVGEEIDVPEGTTYTEGGREYVHPTRDWIARVDTWNTLTRYPSGQTKDYRNDFVMSVLNQLYRYGRITTKQFDAINKIDIE